MTILLTPLSLVDSPTSKTVTLPAIVNKPSARYFSSAVLSLCIYILINLWLQLAFPHLIADNYWSRTAHSAVAQFKDFPTTPGIVFVGSSVMGRPIWWVDHAHYQIAPYPNHRRMKWLPNELAKTGLGDVQAYNFSLDAAMVTDVYLLCDKLFKDSRTPELVIYGINRRDVLGSIFRCETTTPAFKLFFEPSDCFELSHLYSASVDERFELVLGQLIPAYRYRQILQDDSFKAFQRARNLLPCLFLDQISSIFKNRTKQNQNSASESSGSPPANEVRKFSTYSMDKLRVKNQEAILKLLAQLILKRHSHLLIVNMPLREDFLLKAKPVCTEYEETLKACAKLPNTFFLDMEKNDAGFGNDCFEDWFHLNTKGAQRVLTRIAGWLTEHKECLEKNHEQ